ncbi:MAG: dipeptidase [Acetobacteraceae bacterium]|nr:dipeptidase [Acetobacteraceae bacterium]
MSDAVVDHLLARKEEILEQLKSLLRLPSVSTDPAYAEGMRAAREFLLARLREIGMQDVRLLEAGGQPVVYGAWTGAPGRPTLIIYGHYDVQPPDPLELWQTPPFEPSVRDGRLYARGASDVKGSTLIAVETVGAFLAVQGGCPVNVKLFLEGEEEVGSPSLPALIDKYRDLLAADAMLSADGGRASTTIPTVSVGCRGICALQVALRTAAKDAHSGRVGGAVRNALHEMAKLVASLHDDQGRIRVEGFLDGAIEVTPELRAESAALPFDEARWYADLGAAPFGDPDYTVVERITLRPTVEVNGMWGGYTGAGGKTVLPCEAFAKLTMRLVPGQDPAHAQEAVKRHFEAHCPPGVELRFDYRPGGTRAFTLPSGHPLLAAAERVTERVHGVKPVRTRAGGTVPITTLFQEKLGIDSLMFGLAMPDEDAHAPNEFFRLASLEEGLKTWPLLLTELGALTPAAFPRR